MMKKKKVLHILNTGSYSGAENVVISIINNTREDIDSVYLSKNGSICEILKENDISFYPIKNLSFFELRRALKKIRPDIIHAHDFTAGIISAISTLRIPIINHIHNNSPWIKTYGWKSILYATSTLRYKKILTVSESVMEEFVFAKLCEKKTIVIGNPVDLEKIKNRVENKNVCEPYDIAFLGRLSVPKNPLLFLEIIHGLKIKMPEIQAKIIGDGVLRDEVEKRIKELNLEENVVLLGFQSNPYEYLYQAKVLCMPSKWEGFGLAAVEAIALTKPVVAARVGGIVNIVDEFCGKLCSTKEEYVDECMLLLKDEIYYQKKVSACEKKAVDMVNKEYYLNKIYDVYEIKK